MTQGGDNLRSYLVEEPPLLVLPTLAHAIGLNEAILLQQIQYWISKSGKERDGRLWIYNSVTKWKVQFPFWSGSTIRRVINSLRDQGLIEATGKYNKMPMDKTLWYSVNMDKVAETVERFKQDNPTIYSS